eukprot:1818982-Pyramimonas_sp.AAC.1
MPSTGNCTPATVNSHSSGAIEVATRRRARVQEVRRLAFPEQPAIEYVLPCPLGSWNKDVHGQGASVNQAKPRQSSVEVLERRAA